jgi:hypothetical protein
MNKNFQKGERVSSEFFQKGLTSTQVIVGERSRFRERIFNFIRNTCFISQAFGILFILYKPLFGWAQGEIIGFITLVSIPDIVGLLAGKLFNYDVDERLILAKSKQKAFAKIEK